MNTVRLPALFTPSQQQPLLLLHSRPLQIRCSSQNGAILSAKKKGPIIAELPLEQIRRPLLRTRNNNPEKVQQLMDSIADIGLQEPIDVLEVEGVYYGTFMSSRLYTLLSHVVKDNSLIPGGLMGMFFWVSQVRSTSETWASYYTLQDPARNSRDSQAPSTLKKLQTSAVTTDSVHKQHAAPQDFGVA